MEHPTVIGTHHGPTTRLSRLSVYRLKRAGIERDAAIEQAQKRYMAEVQRIFDVERQALAPPRRPALANDHPWSWFVDLRALAGRLRHG